MVVVEVGGGGGGGGEYRQRRQWRQWVAAAAADDTDSNDLGSMTAGHMRMCARKSSGVGGGVGVGVGGGGGGGIIVVGERRRRRRWQRMSTVVGGPVWQQPSVWAGTNSLQSVRVCRALQSKRIMA